MQGHEFTIYATDLDPEASDFADRFYEAGCDDAVVGFQNGVIFADFTREADTIEAAITSAIKAVRSTGATVLRVDPSNIVNLDEIADLPVA